MKIPFLGAARELRRRVQQWEKLYYQEAQAAERARAAVRALDRELDEMSEANDHLANAVGEMSSRIEELEQENNQLDQENARLHDEIENYQALLSLEESR